MSNAACGVPKMREKTKSGPSSHAVNATNSGQSEVRVRTEVLGPDGKIRVRIARDVITGAITTSSKAGIVRRVNIK
jgi:hypothetical protein